ncbi:MAG: hypothetical protein JJ863_17655 [Deltaproteobacteria bacterium]|nr:hypothetical protein [Deltaproteobacteria bacterium]
MSLDWVEPYGNPTIGVDHLGMRVAGEAAYGHLIDFTTTVTYRPRYLSFLCWSLREAWSQHARSENEDDFLVDYDQWRDLIKQHDFAFGAASLAADPGTARVVGSRALTRLLSQGTDAISNTADHVRGRGSIDIYAGILRSLELSAGAQGVERAVGAVSEDLAELFDAVLGPEGRDLLHSQELTLERLRDVGRIAGVSQLRPAGASKEAVAAERALLRKIIIPIERTHELQVRRRLASIGVIIRLHEALGGDVDSGDFRSAVLDRVVLDEDQSHHIPFAAGYDEVLGNWRWYQVRAYAVHALEVLLAAVLAKTRELGRLAGSIGAPVERVIASLLVEAEMCEDSLPSDLRGLASMPAEDCLSHLAGRIRSGADRLEMEPDISRRMNQAEPDSGERTATALTLYLMSLARMRVLREQEGTDAWLGDDREVHGPPWRFLEQSDAALAGRRSCRELLGEVVRDFVIRQHVRNAYRKLEADPSSKDTSRLVLEEGCVRRVGDLHSPGSSYPRYENAVSFLTDLGYLNEEREPTDEGIDLAEEIEGALF